MAAPFLRNGENEDRRGSRYKYWRNGVWDLSVKDAQFFAGSNQGPPFRSHIRNVSEMGIDIGAKFMII